MTKRTPKQIAGIAAAVAVFATPLEGIRQVAYYDPPGIPTVCMGHTGPDVKFGKFYTLAECHRLLSEDMLKAVNAVDRCVPDAPNNVLAAFSDAAFNLGPAIACDTSKSTAARKLKTGDWVGACNELPKWDKARIGGVLVALPGLTKRRAMEKELCLHGVL